MKPNFGWDYPAGVTDRDIEKHFGDGDEDESPEERRQRIENERGEDKGDELDRGQ